MNTKLKTGNCDGRTRCFLYELENESEIATLINEADATLLPCAHCGNDRPHVHYMYRPGNMFPTQLQPNGEIPMKECPHELYVVCCRNAATDPPSDIEDCRIQTRVWNAEDTEDDFVEALRRVCSAWNKRTGK